VVISVPPTLLVSSIGIIDDAEKSVSIDFKFEGDLIYLLGDTSDEMGGSEYFAHVSERDKKEYLGNVVPKVDVTKNRKLYTAYNKCVKTETIASAISLEKGGLGAALMKSSVAGMLGCEISIENIGKGYADDHTLFSESQGRILVSINPKNKKVFETAMKNQPIYLLGKVVKERIKISNKDKKIADIGVNDALNAYKSTFKGF
jgi:phosphoribosylformylglycinamidine synthase